VAICREAGVKELALYHHAPERTDAEVDEILRETRALVERDGGKLSVTAAFEGLELAPGRVPAKGRG
jgi:ribonuclease BN (tRNA processing enzyme)